MANFTLKVETAASKAQANPPRKDPLFYILPPLIVAAVFAVVYGMTPPKSATAPKETPAAEAPAETVTVEESPTEEVPAEETPEDSE